MANNLINAKADKIVRYKGILQIDNGTDTFQYKFIQDMEVTFDDEFLQRDRIDDGTPVFTRVGDIYGRFKFNFKETIDLFDSVNPPTNTRTLSYWINQLAIDDPAVVKFIETKQAPNSAGNKFGRMRFDGRITKVNETASRERAVDEAGIEGEITAFTSALRQSS